ncbi:MAG: hypothetical protein AB1757_09545 [Acidobacteriota bacterium]
MKRENRSIGILKFNRLIKIIFAAMSLTFLFIGSAEMQSKTPYDKERLLKVVKLNALSTQEVVQAIEKRGVDFQMTPAIEAEFTDAGARPELIETMRNNYRGAKPVATTNPTNSATPTNKANRNNSSVPAGPPLSKNEILSQLNGGTSSERMEQYVEARGVNFAITPEISREIIAAGGSRSLIGAISVNAKNVKNTDPVANNNSRVTPKTTEPDYDDLTDQAISEMQSKRAASAIRLLEKAVGLEPANPTAYQLLGFAQLYGYQNIASAEQSMRAAMERGGAATFRVYHDHDGFFKTYCQGTFFVSKAGVTFKADDGKHTFEAFDTVIKESELNDFVGSEYGAFHIKVFEDDKKKKTKTFNFAPATTKKDESKLVVNLIKSY